MEFQQQMQAQRADSQSLSTTITERISAVESSAKDSITREVQSRREQLGFAKQRESDRLTTVKQNVEQRKQEVGDYIGRVKDMQARLMKAQVEMRQMQTAAISETNEMKRSIGSVKTKANSMNQELKQQAETYKTEVLKEIEEVKRRVSTKAREVIEDMKTVEEGLKRLPI